MFIYTKIKDNIYIILSLIDSKNIPKYYLQKDIYNFRYMNQKNNKMINNYFYIFSSSQLISEESSSSELISNESFEVF